MNASHSDSQGSDLMPEALYRLEPTLLNGQPFPLRGIEGKVALVVNVASKCGFTPQYKELQEIYDKFRDRGFVVLGFPCNQFGMQEPGNESQIQEFCSLNYGVTFPMFSKIEVNGPSAHPLFSLLKKNAPGLLGTEAIKWNFTKFLVDRSGKVVARYAPTTSPLQIAKDIEGLLGPQ